MIHYQLRCPRDHAFDGWFAGSAAFDAQAARGLIECPVCGDTGVTRAMMAPAIPRKGRRPAAPAADAPAPAPPPVPAVAAGGAMPDAMRAALQRIRAEIEHNCDYVGPSFAMEARRIHNGEAKVRGIYGEATPEQAEALADDGIEVSRIPWLPRADG